MKVAAYLRVSTREQNDTGAGLDAQRATLRAEALRRDWEVGEIVEPGGRSGSNLNRPGLTYALELVESGAVEALVVTKLDRLSRSVRDFADIVERARRDGWTLIVLDLQLDTSTPMGEAMAHMAAVFAQLERRMIGQRTREGLAVVRERGTKLGPPTRLKPDIQARIVRERAAGASYGEIARRLNADGVKTALKGRCWYPASVRAIVQRVEKSAPRVVD